MPLNSRRKGKTGELQFSRLLRTYGFNDARRGRQFSGLGAPDVVGLPGYHVEVKYCQAGQIYNWLQQAIDEAAPGAVPIVAHRRRRQDWVVILSASDFLGLLKPKC
jgi:Holliday junction resolvase